MDKLTRRRFLLLSGVAGAGALAVGASQIDFADLFGGTPPPAEPATPGILVMVTLYGGNDGLSTVVPASDRAYQDARPELAYQPEDVLALGEGLGLNPGMTGFKSLWDERRLAVVRGAGYPRPNRSHFTSMDIWQTASPQVASTTGWLGRWLDTAVDDPLLALSLEPILPPLLVGAVRVGASLPLTAFALPQGGLAAAFRRLGEPDPTDDALHARAARSTTDLFTLRGASDPILGPGRPPAADPLAAQLDTIATLIEAGLRSRVYSVSIGGFDTHADERGTQEQLLRRLDGAVAPFVTRMRGTEHGRDVVVVVYSEFGRRVSANGSDGTDHGTAAPLFLAGDRVRGGFYGEQPSLTDLDDGDLKATSDFRDVYATVLEEVLGSDADPLLDGHRGRLTGVLEPFPI